MTDHPPADDQSWDRLCTVLSQWDSVLIAFSGGVDSTLLLYAAIDTLGPKRVQAITALSPLRPQFESERAQEIGQSLGIRHTLIESRELELSEVASNAHDRCYHCKKWVFQACVDLAHEQGLSQVCDGTNLDDLETHRPGHRALQELGIRSPLAEAGLTKSDVRRLSRTRGLTTWNLPAYSCLATRFPYNTTLTPEGLKRIEDCEAWLHQKNFHGIRVRDHGDTARLEVPVEAFPRLIQSPLREELIDYFKNSGFHFVCLDLEGFRSGSMDTHLIP